MATINNSNLTLLDRMKRSDPGGAIAAIVEVLDKLNPEVRTAVFKEGNLVTGHTFTSRTGLPSVGPRRFNQGVDRSKSKTDQITETCMMLAGASAVDKKLAELNGDVNGFRATEDTAFMESFAQRFGRSLWYDSTTTDPGLAMGLTPRLDRLTGNFASQVISADASASGNDQASIWGVVWGENEVFGITPKGSPSGLQPLDMGLQLIPDENGKLFPAYVTNWEWTYGFCVKDYRKIVRVCNIDTGNLSMSSDTLFQILTKAYYRLTNPGSGRLVWYCNRTMAEFLEHQARSAVKGGGQLSYSVVEGKPITTYRGAPIEVTDSLTSTEAVVA